MSLQLTNKHQLVLQYLAEGKSIQQIATDLSMSRRMIDIYIMQAKDILNARTSPEAVAKAMKFEIIDIQAA